MNDLGQTLRSAPEDSAHPLLTWSEDRLGVGVPMMDGYHQEFLSILAALSTMPDGVFATLFAELVRHTHEHFSQEEKLMRETGFSAAREHIDEHRRVIGDLEAMKQRVQRGRLMLPREYVKNGMPEWFALHLATMDSALAAHLKTRIDYDQD